MLQRIQTIYMIVAAVVMGVVPFVARLWTNALKQDVFFMQVPMFAILFGLSFTLSIVSIMSYKTRQKQFVYNRLNIISNFILLGLFVYRSLNVSGEATELVSEKGIGMFLPLVSIILLALANKAIKKDEDLVKSVDRLR
ncbi:MAG: DUF4293 domain-containing protein [Flavobacteriaceae bacterium]|jgi:hypothetical protein|nr:DUF4293 domain-containing protein [Flavobacteriaceae bacterium]